MSKQVSQLSAQVKIISEENAGNISKIAIARMFGIPKSRLSGILKDCKRLLSAFNDGDFAPQHKRMQMAAHKNMESTLLTWIQRV